MNNRTAKLIDEQRVMELLDCYGASSERWPEEERAAAVSLIKQSVELQRYQQEAQQLDEAMQIHEAGKAVEARPSSQRLSQIIDGLPEQPRNNTVSLTDRIAKKPSNAPAHWWKYSAVAAAAVVVLAVALVIQQPHQTQQPGSQSNQPLVTAAVTQSDLDQWFWEQATGVSDDTNTDLSQDTSLGDNDEPVTFMAMVDLETSTDRN